MEIDLTKFLQTFIEESLELLQDMEQALLELDIAKVDLEKINKAFRAVHTLKSSSAAFNFVDMSEFSHTMENFLEPVRSGEKTLTQDEVDLLLKSVDCLRKMVADIEKKRAINGDLAQQLAEKFLHSSPELSKVSSQKEINVPKEIVAKPSEELQVSSEKSQSNDSGSIWLITFTPDPDIWKQGGEPLRVFQELSDVGMCAVHLCVDKLPDFSTFDPEICYLSWEIKLQAPIAEDVIREMFHWVGTDKNIEISRVSPTDDDVLEKEVLTENAPEQKSRADIKPIVADAISKEVVRKVEADAAPTTTSIRVNTEKIDTLINLVGELVITQSMLSQITKDFTLEKLEKLQEGLALLEHNSRELQESAIQIRMLPIGGAFNRFPRAVHDLATKLGKKVELKITGEQTEIDRSVMEKIIDPLLHLIRNAVDHGFELPDERKTLGKPEVGTLAINTYQAGGNIVVDVKDDGRGLNIEKIREKALSSHLISEGEELSHDKICALIFQPGFSTATAITDVSGRGVGMDVVYRGIHDLGGSIDLHTEPGLGTTFSLRLPLTLAILECQLVKIADQRYAVPLISIVEIIKIDSHNISSVDAKTELYYLRKIYVPIIYLAEIFGIPFQKNDLENKFLIIVEVNGKMYGLACDDIMSQQQIVIKSLQDNYQKIPGISGATILGDGSVALIVDVNTIVDIFREVVKTDALFSGTAVENVENRVLDINDDEKLEFLGFFLGEKEFAISILDVLEIRTYEASTPLPNVPPYIKGVVNLRGVIVPLVDLRQRLGLQQVEYTDKNAIIILDIHKNGLKKVIGIIVDSVSDTYSISGSEIKPLPEGGNLGIADYVIGLVMISSKTVTLLYTDHLISFSNSN